MSSPALDLDNEDRRSLYEFEKSRLGEKVIAVHRMIFIGSLKEETEKRLSVAGKIQEDIANFRDKDDENLSGLMLMYTKHFIQILEETIFYNMATIVGQLVRIKLTESGLLTIDLNSCSEKIFVSVARYLNDNSESSLIEKAKLISISHDISQRLFKVVHVSALDIQAQNLHSYQPSESAEKLIIDTVGQMLKLGAQIVKLPKPGISKCLENLHMEHPDLLPQQAVLNYLLKEDDGCLITMEEFITLHNEPFDVTFYSELVWPLEARLYPNNYMT